MQARSQKAIRHLKYQLKYDPDNYELCTQLAILRFLQYDDVKAMKLVKKALFVNG